MPSIFIKNTGQRIETTMVRSILVTLQSHGIPIETVCGGKAMCGKCVVRVLEGQQFLSPVNSREAKRLEAIGADENMRLACQTYIGRDVAIEIINFGS
ncbi:hypothetical protein GF1_18670 [Desulfolithobacter dissulfuricans]|uniref:2Fe-2S ferredoxin-type domain-containing protein n=1 Tax=Desulfolithobacter dissulfuricans TaxID=2795293 RepID=A0A915XLB6_9BACT|nr:2Fe-2S iron-sulfur cluster-binding protein [Desulfolithobacter dissulfuricans]BCO09491.1 hypothetical protein GF1_18670 [Desulfolithobacter dissulfuricans]